MSGLIRFYPGDSVVGFLVVVTLGVALASSAGYLISLRLGGKAALRHLVLFCALICCLASPAAAWFCAAAGVTIVSVPIFGSGAANGAAELAPIRTQRAVTPTRPPGERLSATADLDSPRSSTKTVSLTAVATPRVIDRGRQPPARGTTDVKHSTQAAAQASTFRHVATVALLVWVAGTLLILVRLAGSCVRVVQLRCAASLWDYMRILDVMRDVVNQLGARRAPLLLVSSDAIVPMAIALGRRAVILPKHVLGAINDIELKDILVHEVAHLERGDPRIMLLQDLAGAFYWPILSVHGLNRELERAREEICDNIVLAARDAIGYGETLLHVAELSMKARRVRAAVAIIGGPGRLERRIASLIDPERNKMIKTGRKTAYIVAFLFAAWCAFASATRFVANAGAADKPASDSSAAVVTTGSRTETHAETKHEGPQNESPQRESPQRESPQRDIGPPRLMLLRGKVLGPGDRPIAGARLYLSVDEWTDPVELGTSDASGAYRFVFREEKLRRTVSPNFVYAEANAALIAVASGFGPGWAELPAAKGGRMGEMKPEYAHDIHLVADFPIAGKVVDSGGKPVAGVALAVDRIFELSDPRWRLMHPAIKAGNPFLMTRQQCDTNNWFTPLYPTAFRMIPPAVTDSEGRFQLAGVGGDRAIRLEVSGPGIRYDSVSVITRDDVAEFTQAIRTKYPRTPRPNGYFYPPRASAPEGDQGLRLFGPSPTIDVDPARTVSGVVRDATTGEPIAGHRMAIATGSGYASYTTDKHGRYRILRDDDQPSIVIYSDQYHTDRYLIVVRHLDAGKGFGDVVANFDIPRGVIISGRVLEAGTDQPIVSAPRQGCHDSVPGPLIAGNVSYFPLANNAALRGAPTGLYFEGFGTGTNYYRSVSIDGDGRFRMAVPPGAGVLVVQASPGLPMFAEMMTWKESDGYHRLFPYLKLSARAKGDGGPGGAAESFPGFMGPIPVSNYVAYRVINPASDTKSLDLTISVPRAPSRKLRFVGPDGREIRTVTVKGLLAAPSEMAVVFTDSEAEVLALEPGKPREVTATTNDGKYTASALVGTEDPEPRIIRLEAAR